MSHITMMTSTMQSRGLLARLNKAEEVGKDYV